MSGYEATVYVGNLPWDTTEDDLVRLFGQFADVVNARVIQNRETGRPQGYAFVDLATVDQVAPVCAALDRCRFNGRWLQVKPARAKPVRQ